MADAPFSLPHALAAWRRSYEYRPGMSADDLDELACHLLDEMETRTAAGWEEEAAFRAAVQALGVAAETGDAYRTVHWAKLKHRRQFGRHLASEASMFWNNLRLTLRTLKKQRLYTGLNVAGLALSLACCLLIALFIAFELSYDRFHENADRIYRVVQARTVGQETTSTVTTPVALAEALESRLPGIEVATRFGPGWPGVIQHGVQQYHESKLFFAEPTAFEVFDLRLHQGDPATALTAPNSVVLTEATARKYFGEADPIGQTLTYTFEGSFELTVTGIVEEMPPASHYHFDFLVSVSTLAQVLERMRDNWEWSFLPTYLLLERPTEPKQWRAPLQQTVAAAYPAPMSEEVTLSLQPLTDIHLYSHHRGEIEPNGQVSYLYLFGSIALAILMIACINFTNLTTARSLHRATEVGVRKALGASRGNLVRQFLGETMLLSALAVGLALALLFVLVPVFNRLLDIQLSVQAQAHALGGALLLAVLALGVGMLAGAYPAWFLSAYQPAAVLRKRGGRARGVSLRKVLVVGQFAMATVLVFCLWVMAAQVRYALHLDPGFESEALVYLRSPQRDTRLDFTVFENALADQGIQALTGVSNVPGSGQPAFNLFATAVVEGERVTRTFGTNFVEADFAATYGLSFVAGRDFRGLTPSDSTEGFLINESAARAMGWQVPEALGQFITLTFEGREEPIQEGVVVGVLEDFHFETLHEEMRPLILSNRPVWNYTYFVMRLAPGPIQPSVEKLEKAWKTVAPEWPLDLQFMEAQVEQIYEQEVRLSRLMGGFAGFALLVACLGLFGLAAYLTEQRRKEIGVRKALGASKGSIVQLLTREFLVLVAVACLVALPVGYWLMHTWLSSFAYRIPLGPHHALIVALLMIGVTLLTVAFQAIKAGRLDPVQALRYE